MILKRKLFNVAVAIPIQTDGMAKRKLDTHESIARKNYYNQQGLLDLGEQGNSVVGKNREGELDSITGPYGNKISRKVAKNSELGKKYQEIVESGRLSEENEKTRKAKIEEGENKFRKKVRIATGATLGAMLAIPSAVTADNLLRAVSKKTNLGTGAAVVGGLAAPVVGGYVGKKMHNRRQRKAKETLERFRNLKSE